MVPWCQGRSLCPLAMSGLCSWSVAKIGRVVGIATARCRGRWACEETGTTGVGGLRLHVQLVNNGKLGGILISTTVQHSNYTSQVVTNEQLWQ